MVCIPCIVIPVLLWVYKRFLEPYLYPFISPFIKRIWPNKAVKEISKQNQNSCSENEHDSILNNPSRDGTQLCKTKSNGIANGFAANGPSIASDKKTD